MDKTEVTYDMNGNPRTMYIISYEDICNKVKELTDGENNSYHKQTFVTPDYESVTHNQILDICKNRFSGYKTKAGTGSSRKRVVEFIKEDVEKEGMIFDAPTDIKIIENEGSESQSQSQEEDKEDELEVWADWKRQTV